MAVIKKCYTPKIFNYLATQQRTLANLSYSKTLRLKSCISMHDICQIKGTISIKKQRKINFGIQSDPCLHSRSISSFPSFSTNEYKGFISSPTIKIAANMILSGKPHGTELPSSILKKLDQSPPQLLDGSLMAIESLTELIEQTVSMKKDEGEVDNETIVIEDLVTDQCHERLREQYSNILNAGKDIHLVNTPRDDILFAWIEKLKEISDGTITMTVCTLSFPNFGEMARKIQDVEKSQKEFHKDLLRRAPELEKEEFRSELKEFHNTLFDPREFIKSNEIAVANFEFKYGSNKVYSWLINEVSINCGSKVQSKIAAFRWRGRMQMALRGYDINKLLRWDYTTDYIIYTLFSFLVVAILLA